MADPLAFVLADIERMRDLGTDVADDRDAVFDFVQHHRPQHGEQREPAARRVRVWS